MARRRKAVALPDDTFGLYMVLAGGPGGPDDLPYSEEQLELSWQHFREELMDKPREPGDHVWAYWHFELGIEQPATRLEQVLALHERALLTEEERREIASDGERARKRYRNPYVVISPAEAAESMERMQREREDGRSPSPRRSRRRTVHRHSVCEHRDLSWRDRLRRLAGREKPPAPLCEPLWLVVERGCPIGYRCEGRKRPPVPRAAGRSQAMA